MELKSIHTINDLRKFKPRQLTRLSHEIRELIIDVISKNGGHLSSSLGVVDLTIALHYVFNTPVDKIIWDVGHQAYAHKILTGRQELFPTIRSFGGLSGFPKINESEFDTYNVGHSSTSLSLALGEAVGRDLSGLKHKVVAVIGDGSLTGGIALEALNNIGHMDNDLIIILNDNEHSISKNVGGLSQYLTRIISGSFYNKFRKTSMRIIKKIPKIGPSLHNFIFKVFVDFKGMITPGQFFEDLGIRYFGPVDGHNLEGLIDLFSRVKKINFGPKLIHVITKKGKGYKPAEDNPAKFHGVSAFDKETGLIAKKAGMSYSEVVGKTIVDLAGRDNRIVAITAAMTIGTGLSGFMKKYPDRFFDVGIAEQHAVTFAGALANTGKIPFVSIYSTFLQRAIDQMIHDIAIMNLPIKLLIDRAGIVGDDGETHHGVFDIALLRSVPNLVILAPSDGCELRDCVNFSVQYNDGPIAIRFPRGNVDKKINVSECRDVEMGKCRVIKEGTDLSILALGDMVENALQVRELLAPHGIDVEVVSIFSVKPLDIDGIVASISKTKHFMTIENGVISGGIGEGILAKIDTSLHSRLLFTAGFPDEFITHGNIEILMCEYGLAPACITQKILENLQVK